MTSTTEQVWDYLLKSGLTAAGAAGLMGNLKAESGIIPNRVEILCLKRLREHGRTYSDQSYTAAVDSGAITKSEFLHPIPGKQYGYGIAQWTSPNRKAGLYDLAQSKGVSIGDLDTQLEYLIRELKTSYKPVYSVLISTNSVQTASDAVLTHFEQPANAQSMKQERANYGYQYFNQFASKGDDPVSTVTADKILDIYRSWIGYSEANGKHKKIVDLYNSHKPLARGYAVRYSDSWCDTCLSAAFIKAGAVTLIGGTECGVEEHIKIFKSAGIWIEDGTITPRPGDIIVYNWDQKTQPNDGYADHIGIVESVSGNMITTIEGNYKDSVGRRTIAIGNGQIRGYARPRYAAEAQQGKANVADPKQKVYHVQAATFTDRKYADQLVLKLKTYGIDSYSYQKSGYWLVQAGAFASKANAGAMLKRLKDLGISGMIW